MNLKIQAVAYSFDVADSEYDNQIALSLTNMTNKLPSHSPIWQTNCPLTHQYDNQIALLLTNIKVEVFKQKLLL